jgi:hypothetical protein
MGCFSVGTTTGKAGKAGTFPSSGISASGVNGGFSSCVVVAPGNAGNMSAGPSGFGNGGKAGKAGLSPSSEVPALGGNAGFTSCSVIPGNGGNPPAIPSGFGKEGKTGCSSVGLSEVGSGGSAGNSLGLVARSGVGSGGNGRSEEDISGVAGF